jgi:hypothetical protein
MPLGLVFVLSPAYKDSHVLHRLFLEHPQSVGETYLEHQRQAFGFAGTMILGALACLVHGLVPSLFTRTGSSTVLRLHERMLIHRASRRVCQTDAPPVRLTTDMDA